MWSSDRRRLLGLIAALPVAACGFRPAYGPGGPARGLMGTIAMDDPADKNAYDLVGALQDRLGRASQAAWRLSYKIATQELGLGITASNAITRYNITGSVDYTVRRAGSDTVVAAGRVSDFTSYSASGTVVSTTTSQRDAYQRLMQSLADQIVTRLIATSADWARQ